MLVALIATNVPDMESGGLAQCFSLALNFRPPFSISIVSESVIHKRLN